MQERKMAKKVQLYYDVISPYSWVAFETLSRYRTKWNISLEYCPFSLRGIMLGAGNRPPGMVHAKSNYMGKDLRRISQYFKIPLSIPSNVPEVMFKKGSQNAQLLLTAVRLTVPDRVEELSRQLWLRVWSRDEDITTDESLREACIKAGLSQEKADELIGKISQEQIKEELKKSTQEALDLGAFGAPFIVAHVNGKKERFFGGDRMELLAHTLGEKWEGPLIELAKTKSRL